MHRTVTLSIALLLLCAAPRPGLSKTSWTSVNAEPGQDNGVISLSATDSEHGWALVVRNNGQNSELVGLRTTSGTGWQQMMLPQGSGGMFPPFFTAIAFSDASTGYLSGFLIEGFNEANKIWRSTDGGSSWTEVATTDSVVSHFQILSTGDVYGVAGDSFVHSSDGVTWTSVAVPSAGANVTPKAVFMLNQTCGWLVGGWGYDGDGGHLVPTDGAVWYTQDGGQTWAVMAQALPYYLTRAHWVAADLGFAVGNADERGVILRTTDSGQTFTELTVPEHPAMPDVCMMGFCVDEAQPLSDVADIRFWDAQRGIALGLACTSPPCDRGDSSATYLTSFLRTTDGGQTWTHDPDVEPAMPELDMMMMTIPGEFAKQVAMAFPDPNHGFLGGQHNMILRYVADSPEGPAASGLPDCDSSSTTTGDGGIWQNDPTGGDGGCGCAATPPHGTAIPWLLLLALWLTRRRRYRPSPPKTTAPSAR